MLRTRVSDGQAATIAGGLVVLVSVLLSACGGNKASGSCSINGDCGKGEVCFNRRCVASGLVDGGSPCTMQSDCTGNEVCMNGTCQMPSSGNGCTSNADCASSANGPVCLLPAGVCGACVVSNDCNDPKKLCQSNQCVWVLGYCSQNSDCAAPALSATPVCNTSTNTCVQCVMSSDCGTGYECNSDNVCQVMPPSGCQSDGDCTNPELPHCSLASGMCVQCIVDGDCTSGNCVNNVCEAAVLDAGPPDSGQPPMDAGQPDSGQPQPDAGMGFDAGSIPIDPDGGLGGNCTQVPDTCTPPATCTQVSATTYECTLGCDPNFAPCIQGTCVYPGICAAPCTMNSDCGRADFVCQTQTGGCEPDCRLQGSDYCLYGQPCDPDTGLCTSVPCGTQGGQCPATDVCYNEYTCAPECMSDMDCPHNMTCVGGACTDTYQSCSTTQLCGGYLDLCYLVNGSSGVCLNECSSDSNCPSGQNCGDLGGLCAKSCTSDGDCPAGSSCDTSSVPFSFLCGFLGPCDCD